MEQIDYSLLYRIAKSYYLDGQTQERIAKRENISRPHVSRMLAKARDCGVVKIKVEIPGQTDVETLGSVLCACLHLKQVRIASVPPEYSNEQIKISQIIAAAAAVNMPELLGEARTVGIGWGYTIYQAVLLMDQMPKSEPINFLPLVGISGDKYPYFQINVIVDRFVEKLGGQSFFTIMPAIRDNGVEMGRIEAEGYMRLRQQWDGMDAAVIGLGPAPGAGRALLSEASDEYNRRVSESGTIGDILANFFYTDGSVFDTSADYQQISFPLNKLPDIKTVICAAGGPDKVEGIIAAARNRFFNVLITDEITAHRILEHHNIF